MAQMWMSSGIYIATISKFNEEGKNFGLFFGILYCSGLVSAIFLLVVIPMNYGNADLFNEILWVTLVAILLFCCVNFDNLELDDLINQDESTIYDSQSSMGSL